VRCRDESRALKAEGEGKDTGSLATAWLLVGGAQVTLGMANVFDLVMGHSLVMGHFSKSDI